MSLLSEVLVISGVAMDLVGAVVLSHAHNAESMVDIRVYGALERGLRDNPKDVRSDKQRAL